jgi:hypothetical protein
MTPTAEPITKPNGHALSPQQRAALTQKLDRDGRAELAPGAVAHRPLRDAEPPAPERPDGIALASERAAVATACKPLAQVEGEQARLDEACRAIRHGGGKRETLPTLDARAAELKASHAQVRGTARMAILGALDAATLRAAREYTEAAHMVADAAAKYEGLAALRDDLTGSRAFDPLGLWRLTGTLLAPELAHRPRGWSTTPDAYGRPCLWHAGSVAHLDAVRRTQAAFKAEMASVIGDARWPF